MAMKRGIKILVAEAMEEIETVPVDEAEKMMNDENVTIFDIRDVRELDREGMIPGAVHTPRGMLEFWVDPDSPYHKEVFATGKKMVFYCAAAWRSALATKAVQDMGLENVAHIEGGFKAWKESNKPIVERPKKEKK
ncbi:MAG: rhodanese-like domain-containing protein [Rhodospirillales bacterium]|nr:rhodanese-like domain-containing protein [Rhodospirillales bacterium]